MYFTLLPREDKFFDMFDQAVAILSQAAGNFLALVMTFDHLEERGQQLKLEESRCDEIIERIIHTLDLSFITPFDREDIHRLATTLDNVLDNMEESAHRFVSFRIGKPTAEAVALTQIIKECCNYLEQAVRACRNLRQRDEIQNHLRAIGRLENEADKIYRDSDAALFADGRATDVLTLIKWRELYRWLEETVDACKQVSHVVAEIVVKGS